MDTLDVVVLAGSGFVAVFMTWMSALATRNVLGKVFSGKVPWKKQREDQMDAPEAALTLLSCVGGFVIGIAFFYAPMRILDFHGFLGRTLGATVPEPTELVSALVLALVCFLTVLRFSPRR